jgi:hypothetical protein
MSLVFQISELTIPIFYPENDTQTRQYQRLQRNLKTMRRLCYRSMITLKKAKTAEKLAYTTLANISEFTDENDFRFIPSTSTICLLLHEIITTTQTIRERRHLDLGYSIHIFHNNETESGNNNLLQ